MPIARYPPNGTPYPAHSTPFPNPLLDTILPTLSDTEWRLLCVIVRATLGWEGQQAGQRKTCDWLTQKQLKQRTGRASEAISRAIDGLVKRGLIDVSSETGAPLNTPQERRACQGRLLFRLAAQQTTQRPQTLEEEGREKKEGKETVKETNIEMASSLYEADCSPAELRKANTTKETPYKILPGRVVLSGTDTATNAVENPVEDHSMTGRHAVIESPSAAARRFLQAYEDMFRQRSARGESPPIQWERDSKLVQSLLAQYGYERLTELLEAFFASEDAWVKKRGYALFCFPTLLPSLLMRDVPRRSASEQETKRRPAAAPVVIHGETGRRWQQASDIAVSKRSLFERYPELQQKVGKPSAVQDRR